MYEKSKKELIEENIPLVKKIANRIFRRIPEGTIEFEDLVNTGIIGLIKAANNYDKSKARFSTYAYIKIRGEILDFLRSMDFLSRTARNKLKKGKKNELLYDEVTSIISIEENLFKNSDKLKIADILASPEKTPEEIAVINDLKFQLAKALEKLSEREKLVLQLIFVEELDLKSIAKILNISVSRISQIKTRALKKLKNILSEK